ncbi:MAG: amidohydrolase [Betaproteobacteria bacterium]|nr:amidohydrolase [Betaproteobacteria bacterium]
MPVIDTHTHFFPQEWIDLLEREGPAHGVTLGRNDSGAITFACPGIRQVFAKPFIDLGIRLKAMDKEGVDVHSLSLTTPMVYWPDARFGLKLAQTFNDACSAACVEHPKRFVGMAILPMQDAELALRELERAAKLPGMRGLYLGNQVNKNNLDDPSFFPVYAKCEAIGWPIFLHPIDPLGAERLDKYYLRNLIGYPYSTAIAAASLIFGGVMDRFPKLDVVLPHAGGMFPPLIGRWDHGTEVREEMKHMKQLPSAYLRRFYYDTIAHNDELMMNVVRQVGVDRIVMGSDYCFQIGDEHPVATVNRLSKSISVAEREMILGKTAARLLKL